MIQSIGHFGQAHGRSVAAPKQLKTNDLVVGKNVNKFEKVNP
jgi:hypothetical protein